MIALYNILTYEFEGRVLVNWFRNTVGDSSLNSFVMRGGKSLEKHRVVVC